MFGGQNTKWSVGSSIIAAFPTDEKEWRNMGNLNTARESHGVIIHHGEFLILGGYSYISEYEDDLNTEKCTLSDDKKRIFCKEVGPLLVYSYYLSPAMMLVPYDYCQK